MPTVIDSLILELGLDPSKFTKGQKEALDAFKKTGEAARKQGTQIEESAGKGADALRSLGQRVLALGAAYLGLRAIKDFARDQANVGRQAGNLSRILDTGVEALTAWRGAAVLVGGTAAGMDASIKGLVAEFQTFALTGQSNVIPYFRALNVEVADAVGKMRPMNDLLLDLSDRLSKMDPAKAAAFGRALGFDEGTITLLLRGRKAIEGMLAEQKRLGAITEEEAKSAAALAESWDKMEQSATSLGRYLLSGLTPAMSGTLDKVTGLVTKFNEWLHSSDTWVDRLDRASGGAITSVLGAPKKKTEAFGPPMPASSPSGVMTPAEQEAYIRESARRHGINPEIAVKVARSEGLGRPGNIPGDNNSSFGPFQLHYGGIAPGMMGKGLGDKFTRETGLDARDAATMRQQIDFAMKEAAAGGWSPWMGAKAVGVAPWAGIGGPQQAGNTTTTTTEVKIDNLIVHSAAPDAAGIAGDIRQAITRQSSQAQQVNSGAQ